MERVPGLLALETVGFVGLEDLRMAVSMGTRYISMTKIEGQVPIGRVLTPPIRFVFHTKALHLGAKLPVPWDNFTNWCEQY